jgi:hypothetical protein
MSATGTIVLTKCQDFHVKKKNPENMYCHSPLTLVTEIATIFQSLGTLCCTQMGLVNYN